MAIYYPPYKSSTNNVKVELDLTNYATKTDLKNITHVDVSSFASMQITKNATDNSKNNYKGYGICFDEVNLVIQ